MTAYIDFETFYSRTVTLKKMTIDTYVGHPDFKVHGVSLAIDDGPIKWYTEKDAAEALQVCKNQPIVCHNAYFDAYILRYCYGVVPPFIYDTMCMARAIYGPEKSAALKSIAGELGLGHKDTLRLMELEGVRDLSSDQEQVFAEEYAKPDVEMMRGAFKVMLPGFPQSELDLIDLTIRMYTEPTLLLNPDLLEENLTEVQQEKRDSLMAVSWVLDYYPPAPQFIGEYDPYESIRSILASNQQFAELLTKLGITPPMKKSVANGEPTYAFSKKDVGFIKLLEHKDERIKHLAQARLEAKSTIEETRTKTFQKKAHTPFPIQLMYYGAHTGRYSLPIEAEVFTERGWVQLKDWNKEPILQWENMDLTWCNKPGKYEYEYDGELVGCRTKYFDNLYTPEHVLPGYTSRNTFTSLTAMERKGKTYEAPLSGYLDQEGIPVADALLRLIVAVQADGHIIDKEDEKALIFGLVKTRKINRLTELLDSASMPYLRRVDKLGRTIIRINKKHLPDVLWTAKQFPLWFYQLSLNQMDVVLNELIHWDGYRSGPNSVCYVTTNHHNAQLIATLSHLCGLSSFTKELDRTDKGWNIAYKVQIRWGYSTTRVTKKNWDSIIYSGKVGCPETHTGYFLCRYKGNIFVTGNSGGSGEKKEGGTNLQNLKRGSKLRHAIEAPPGYVLVASDSSQIEARGVGLVAGQWDLVNAFANGRDIYSLFASDLYGFEVSKKTPVERYVGKTCILGLGYGMGGPKLKWTLETGKPPVQYTEERCQEIVKFYRQKYAEIPKLWYLMQDCLGYILRGDKKEFDYFSVDKQGVRLPNGFYVRYNQLRKNSNGEYEYWGRRQGKPQWVKIYGGMATENLIQALARIVVTDQMNQINKRYRVVLMVHDEVVCLAPEQEAEEALSYVEGIMKTPPSWANNWPVSCEAGYGRNYGECK